jgi:hypothetical protein
MVKEISQLGAGMMKKAQEGFSIGFGLLFFFPLLHKSAKSHR